MLELEADRMANLRLLDEEINKERSVVLEERRMRMDDNPSALLYEQFFVSIADTGGPYRHLTIGWANDIKHYTLSDVYEFYKKYYSPSNAVLVIVGDVQAVDALVKGKTLFWSC